jgi:uracil-DNA glycosylase family protein
VHFSRGTLTVGPGATRAQVPPAGDEDAVAALWQTYYTHIFNPARVNLRATRQQMPQKFWKNMQETQLIMPLVRDAEQASQTFIASQPARAVAKPSYPSLADARADAGACTVCPWASDATQTVFGEGPENAPLMVVGEQPGDSEDLQGRPFVGPAGALLMRALAEAGIAREALYITNAVKHFKFEPRGKRRIHQKPNATDVAACRAWLGAELKVVRPRVLLCLGTTAALAVFGKATKLKDVRGSAHQTAACAQTFVTTHPSAILRMPPEAQAEGFAQLVADLRQVREQVEQASAC